MCFSLLTAMLSMDYAFASSNIELIGKEEGLKLLPADTRLELANMYPGAEKSKTITLKNESSSDLSLAVSLQADEESILFNTFQLKIEGDNHQYYSGAMNNIEDLKIGVIPAQEKQQLTLSFIFPAEAGNETQGQRLDFKVIFIASGDLPEKPEQPEQPKNKLSYSTPSDDPQLPGEKPLPEPEPKPEPEPELEPDPEPEPQPEPKEEVIIEPDPPGLTPEEPGPEPEPKVSKPPAALPQTGENPPPVYHLLGAGLMAAGLWLGKTTSKEK